MLILMSFFGSYTSSVVRTRMSLRCLSEDCKSKEVTRLTNGLENKSPSIWEFPKIRGGYLILGSL